ncbi:MAG: hypothetical protein B7Z55_03580 [Planctomycetales bacterium 12-60-4]|nr:MAG: hypothetical protein B7Z55_03580 [Planctomycetales bacterium 12-60-4]
MPSTDPRWHAIDAKLPLDDHARIVRRQVERLDRTVIDQLYQGRGKIAFDPVPLLAMVLYQYLKGRRSPATWNEESRLNEAMQWLGFGYTPSRRAWYNFRDRIGDVVERLNTQLVEMAIAQKHVDATVLAIDGTSIAACASRHHMVTQETLTKRKQLLTLVIDATLPQSQPVPKWVPPTQSGREEVLRRIEIAEEILKERIGENATKRSDKRKDPSRIVVSLTDPIAPLGLDKRKTYRPLYTIQTMVAPASHIIVSYTCEPRAGDSGTLIPMIDKTQPIVGKRLTKVLADGGYFSVLDLRDCLGREIDLISPPPGSEKQRECKTPSGETQIPREEFRYCVQSNSYECPQGHRLTFQYREKKKRSGDRTVYQSNYQCKLSICQACPFASRCLQGKGARKIKRTEGEELVEEQREKMSTAQSKALYRLRGQTVELCFADSKGNRRVDRFHGRGLRRASCETGLMVLSQNLLRLDKLQRCAAKPYKITI